MAATPDSRMPLAGRVAQFGMSPNVQQHAFQQQRIHPPCRLVRHVSEPGQTMKMAVAGMPSQAPPATAHEAYADRGLSHVAEAHATKPSTAPQSNGHLASHAHAHQHPQQHPEPQLHPRAPISHDMSPAHPRSLLRRARSGSRLCCSSRGCGSTADLEEDLESPGSFYCSKCWDKIEAGVSVGSTLRRSRLTALGRAMERVNVREQHGHAPGQELAQQPSHTDHRQLQQQTRQQVQPMCSTPGCNVCDMRLLEEDMDNPGVFYCTACWQTWEQGEPGTLAPHGSGQGMLHPQPAGAVQQQTPPASSFPGEPELGAGHEMAAHTAYVSNTGEGLAALDAGGTKADDANTNHLKDHARSLLNNPHGSANAATDSSASASTSLHGHGYGHVEGQGLSPTIASARSPRPPPAMLLSQESTSGAPGMQPKQPNLPSPSPSQQSPRKLPRGPLSQQQPAAQSPPSACPPTPSAPVVLSVFHDLPHFTRSISEARRAMELLVETKASDERGLLLIKGTISSAHSADGPDYAACSEHPRGGDVLLVSDLEGYVLSQLETCKKQALGGHFGMVRLDPSQGEVFDGRGGAEALPQFLRNCSGALKVILNPSHEGDWFPVSDASSTRPLPPASRSGGGMGYFRMGDDMSKNGAAFLSIDGGNSYIRAATAYGDSDSRSVAPRARDPGVGAHANENAGGLVGPSGASLNPQTHAAVSGTTGSAVSTDSSAVLGAGASLTARLEAGAFYALIQSGWKERHTALNALHHELELLAGKGVQSDAGFAAAVQWTSGECTRAVNETVDACADPNVKVCATALKCVAVLARGLGELFRAEARQMLPTVFKRLKERSRPLVVAARACLDALVHNHCISFSQDMHRELCKAMDPREMRSAAGRTNAGEWVLAWLRSHEIGEVPQEVLEQLAGIVINPVLEDSAPSAKKWATAVLSIVLSEPNCPPQLAAKLMQQASARSARAHNKFRDIMSGVKASDSLAAGPRGAAFHGNTKPLLRQSGEMTESVAQKPAPAIATDVDEGALSGQKFEIDLLLHPRFRVEDDASVRALAQMSAKSLKFLQTLESFAAQLVVPKGKLSRWLLPFDSNTNINDQSARRPPSPRTQAHFREIDARVPPMQKEAMVKDATELRGFVRVKLADDNDLEQARKAMEMTQAFCRHLDIVAQQKGITSFELWQQL